MRFILRMAAREVRASWRRLLFFFLCIGIGVGSIVALRSVIQNANEALTSEARLLLTADVQADSTRPWTPEALAAISRVAQAPLVEARTETVELPTMIRPADPSREGALMVELKGIEAPFPLYGEINLVGGQKFDHHLLAGNGALVTPALLERLQLRVGDEIRINETTFQIRGVIEREPGGGGAGFRLGPRVFVERAAVEQTGLTGFGSRARRRMLFKTPSAGAMAGLVSQLRAELKNGLIGVRSYRDAQENLNEQFTRSENFLALTGLVVLVLGGIGISNVTRVFIEQQRKSIAIMKCVGGKSRHLIAVYLTQTLGLGLAGSLFGVLLAKAALWFVSGRFAVSLPPNMSYALQTGAVLQGIGLGLMISLLFSALPLLRIRHIKPNMLLRDEEGAPRRRVDWLRVATGAVVVCGLAFLSSWQAGSLKIGIFFLAGLAVTSGVLQLAAVLLIHLVRRARGVRSFALRHAISSLHRPGNQTRVIVLAVGLGVFLILSIQSLEANLLMEFAPARRANLPNLFLIDIQKDQAAGVAHLIEETTGERATLVPTVRTRIAAIDGRTVDLEAGEMRRERGRLGREYVVTYRPQLEANEEIVAGQFWDAAPSSEPEVSIEEGMRGLGGLDLGGTITFDVLGRRIDARVTSVRRVDWRNSRTGFLVLFRPGTLENAPQSMIAAINGPADEVARGRFQRALVDKFPNISVIDVADIVRAVTRLLDNVTLAVSFIGLFVLLSGSLILVGSIAMTKFQRVYEAALLKTLGARRGVILKVMLAEYGLLGLVAGLIGAAAAVGLSYVVARFVFEIPWSFTPALSLGGVLATVLLVIAVGAASSVGVLTRKPLAVLRAP